MSFPTIPTVADGRVLTGSQADTTATRTFPDLSGLTKNSGDLLIAICVCYQAGQTSGNFGTWTGGFTECTGGDNGTSATPTMAVGVAYKFSDGTETGTFAVTQAATVVGRAVFIVLSIPGAHASTPPEAGGWAAAAAGSTADAGSFDPAGWAAEDNLWIAVGGDGETSASGSWGGMTSAPASYSGYVDTAVADASTVGQVDAAVAFRQLNAASEDAGTFTVDTSNARNCALVIAVRPGPNATVTPAALACPAAFPAPTQVGPPPALVQSKQGSSATTSLTITLDNPTVAGHGLVVMVAASGTTTNPTAISCQLGGVADHFAQVATDGSASDAAIGACWLDLNCAGGETQVAISATGGSGTIAILATVYERRDLPASAAFDKTSGAVGSSTSWTSNATTTTAQADEVWIGAAFTTTSSAGTITGPSSPWVNLTQVSQAQGSFSDRWMSGYQVVSSTGAATYAGTVSPSSQFICMVVTLKLASAADATATPAALASPAAFPAPVVRQDRTVTAAVHPAPAAFPAVTVTAGGSATATPAVLAAPAAFPVPVVRQDKTVTPSALAAPASFPAPTVTAGGSATATPAALTAPAAFPVPVVGLRFIAAVAGTGTASYLADPLSRPVLLRGDTSWAIPFNAGAYTHTWQEDIDHWVSTRAAQGYNLLVVACLANTQNNAAAEGQSWDAVACFTSPGVLNDTYWDRIDYLVAACEAAGVTAALDPLYSGDTSSGDAGTGKVCAGWTTGNYTSYGTALGNRYKTSPAVLWWPGGDYFDGQQSRMNAIKAAVIAAGDTHLWTVENSGETTSRRDIDSGGALTWGGSNAAFSLAYSYNAPSYFCIEYGWTESSPIPMVWGDGHYDSGSSNAAFMRAMAWWILSSGGRGFNYGAEAVWDWSSGSYAALTSSTFASVTLPAIEAAFTGLPGWHLLVPDTSSVLVTSGRGTRATLGGSSYTGGNTYVTASRTADKSLAVIYLPAAATIGIDEGQIAAGYTAARMDPLTGATTAVSTGTSYNSGSWGNNSAARPTGCSSCRAPRAPSPATLAAPASFPAPTVRQDQTVAAVVLAAPAAFPASVTRQDATVAGVALAAPASFPAPTVRQDQLVTPAALAAPAAFPAVTVTAGGSATATPAVLAAPAAFPPPVVRQDQSVTGAALAAPAAFPAPAVTAGGSATVNAAAHAAPAAFPVPTVRQDQAVTPPVLTAPASFPAATAAAGAAVSGATLAAPASFPAPVVRQDASLSPAVLGAPAAFPAVSVTAGGSATVAAAVLAAPASFPAPVVRQDARPVPTVLAAPAAFGAVSVTNDTTVTPAKLAAPAAFPPVSVSAGGGATISVTTHTAPAAFPAVTVRQDQRATPDAHAAPAAFPGVTVRQDKTVTVVKLSAPAAFPAAQAAGGANPLPVALTVAAAFPAVTVRNGQTLFPAAVAVTVSFPAPYLPVQAVFAIASGAGRPLTSATASGGASYPAAAGGQPAATATTGGRP